MLAVSVPALSLTLACAVFFAASDYFRKVAADTIPPVMLLTVFVAGQVPLLGAWLMASESLRLTTDYWPIGLITAVTGLFANLFFIMAVRVSSLSLTVPILALIPVLTTVFGAVALNEIPTGQQIAGIVLSVGGLFWLYLPDDNPTFWAVVQRFGRDTGARYMLLVALLWSATAPLDKISMRLSSPATHAFIQVCLISGTLIIYLIAFKRMSTFTMVRHAFKPAALASLSAGVAYGCQLVAYQLTLIGIVESLKRVIGLLSALILGRILLHEPMTKHKLTGIALMAAGVPLIILPSIL